MRLEPLLPRDPGRGGRWADHRRTINGVFLRTRTGYPWRDLPEQYLADIAAFLVGPDSGWLTGRKLKAAGVPVIQHR